MVDVIKMKPRHRAALLIVGMYCVIAYFRGISSPLAFLMYGLMSVYGYGKGAEEMDRIIICQRGVRRKSLFFYGVLILFFFLYMLI